MSPSKTSKRIYKGILAFIVCETIFYLFYTFPWALTFYTNIKGTDQKHCHDPMWWWINFTNYFFWSASIWNFLSIPLRYISLRKEIKNEPYEHRLDCHVLTGFVKTFIVWNLISIIIWCSGTYLVYVRLWNKALEWIKKRENEEDLQAVIRTKKQDKGKGPKKQDDDEAPLILNGQDQAHPIHEEDSREDFDSYGDDK